MKFKNMHVSVDRLFQWKTYYGVLEGVPNHAINQQMLISIKEKAKRELHVNTIYLIPPIEKIKTTSTRVVATLPNITCMAELSHYQPMADQSMEYSRLGLIWFQDDYAFPIDSTIKKHVNELEWETMSEDAYY